MSHFLNTAQDLQNAITQLLTVPECARLITVHRSMRAVLRRAHRVAAHDIYRWRHDIFGRYRHIVVRYHVRMLPRELPDWSQLDTSGVWTVSVEDLHTPPPGGFLHLHVYTRARKMLMRLPAFPQVRTLVVRATLMDGVFE